MLPPLLSCEETPSINSGSLHTTRSRRMGCRKKAKGGGLRSSGRESADSVTRGVRSERVLEVRVVARHAQEQVL